MKKKPVDFSFIRYANCWEDTTLLIGNTLPKPNESVLSIASAGDNSLAFLAFDPKEVLAFDINATQLYLTELKQKAIKHLSYEEVLEMLGFVVSKHRIELFYSIQKYLSIEASKYFHKHIVLIENGVIHQGKFENYFRLFRIWFLPFIHSHKTIDKMFEIKSEPEQVEFYHNNWNTWRWRLLFKLFFSKKVLGKYGRDPQFFNENKLPVAETIFRQAERHLQSTEVFRNYYLDYQLRGVFKVKLPFYLMPDNFQKVKINIDKLELFLGVLTDVPVERKFDIMNLSNIFEYMDVATFKVQKNHIATMSKSNTRIAYWNLLVKRELNALDTRFNKLPVRGEDLCFFYQSFNLNSYTV